MARCERLLILAFLGLYAFLALWAASGDASVADEHPHILSGWLFWHSGRFSGGLDNPPLGQLLLAAPLRLLHGDYRFPADDGLYLARLPVVVLLAGLGLLIWRWGRCLGGPGVAGAAAIALCLEPNVLAHGHLATLDVPLVFFWWAALWLWRRVLSESPLAWHAVPAFAIAFALAAATKFTGLFLLPACALAGFAALRGRRAWVAIVGALVASLVVFLLLSHVFYAFEPTRNGLPQHLLQALQGKLAHREEGHFAYLAGRRSLSGFPEYYVVTLLLKTPLPLLLLALCGSLLGWRRLRRVDRALLFLPAALLLLVFSLGGVHIGVRHILPVVPALVLLAGLGMGELWRRGRTARAAVVVVLGLWIASVGRGAPQFLAYFNAIAGGSAGGHRFLLDSNLAWGQDDARLQQFLQESARRGETWEVNPPGRRARTGKMAVDANTLHQLLRADDRPYAWLRSFAPDGHAGFSWHLYDLDLEDFARRAAAHPEEREAQLSYAEVLGAAGDAEAAQAVFEAQARDDAILPVAQRAAWLFLEEGDWQRAATWIARGLADEPGDAELRSLHERLQWEQRQAERPGAASAVALGLWWLQRGEKERALAWLEKARSVESSESARTLGQALLQVGEFAAAARVLAALPGSPELALARGLASAEARFEANERQPVGSDDVAERMELATTMFRTRRYDDAAGLLLQVLRRVPDHGGALSLLGEIQVRSKLRLVPERLTPRPAPGVKGERQP